MKILTGTQIKEADLFTMTTEPIASIDLMERAAKAIADRLRKHVEPERQLLFLVGKGNNGGDGLVVARMLALDGRTCAVCTLFPPEEMSDECRINFERLPATVARIRPEELQHIPDSTLIIDALLGTGVKGALSEPLASFITTLNRLPNDIISIDLPSGMTTEWDNDPRFIVHAQETLTLQFPKLSMLLPEAGDCCGQLHVLPIGLADSYPGFKSSPYSFLTDEEVRARLKSRPKFSHKGKHGHALLVCGSRKMTGAALLAAGGALRSGCALLTVHLPACGVMALNAAFPSAMAGNEANDCFSTLPDHLETYHAIGCGCGLGTAPETIEAFGLLLEKAQVPMVLDADALNILAIRNEWQKRIPRGSILTPHLGELKRIAGEWKNEKEKIDNVRCVAAKLLSTVVVKGAHTMVVMPEGDIFFNSTGNAGMAKGGSGDVLTGLLTGLLANGYDCRNAALIGVYYHGLAGDAAAHKHGKESMNSRDLIDELNVGGRR